MWTVRIDIHRVSGDYTSHASMMSLINAVTLCSFVVVFDMGIFVFTQLYPSWSQSIFFPSYRKKKLRSQSFNWVCHEYVIFGIIELTVISVVLLFHKSFVFDALFQSYVINKQKKNKNKYPQFSSGFLCLFSDWHPL